jgi:hypothetical protein
MNQLRMDTPDREILDTIIIPYFQTGKLCFVGIDKQTQHYSEEKELFKTEVVILDQAPKLGATMVGRVQDLPTLVGPDYFDTIIANGLAHGGTNSPSEIEEVFQGAYDSLAPNGWFIWGWSDFADYRVIDPIFIHHKFKRSIFPPLGTWRYSSIRHLDPNREYDWKHHKIIRINHTYDFYKKEL